MSQAFRDLSRTFFSLAKAPLQLGGRAIHRALTGKSVVLEVRLGGTRSSLLDRVLFLEHLGRAARDEAVSALLLKIESSGGGWAAAEDLHDTLREIGSRGLPVIAILESADNAGLYLSSACTHVFILPSGDVLASGVASTLTFFGGLFRRLGVTPDFEAAGAYKSLAEPFSRTFATAANREAVSGVVGDLHDVFVTAIAAGRNIAAEAVERALSDAPLGAEEALERGLVDTLAYEDEVQAWLEDAFGEDVRVRDFAGWARRESWLQRLEDAGSTGARIAVIHLDGPVVRDASGRGSSVSAREVVPALESLREDEDVAAVVMHVNSPGGSALASDLIWREAARLASEKPLVACFESVAASGGYYIAAPAQHIVVRHSTITGSIGVVGGKLVLGDALRKLGVFTEQVGGTESSSLLSPATRFSDHQRARFRASLQRTYDGFVERVATGRGLEVEAVEPFCRGRIWSGASALDCGLADATGGLASAVRHAETLAGLGSGARLVHLAPRAPRSWIRDLLRRAVGVNPLRVVERVGMGSAARMLIAHPYEPLVLCPWEISTRPHSLW